MRRNHHIIPILILIILLLGSRVVFAAVNFVQINGCVSCTSSTLSSSMAGDIILASILYQSSTVLTSVTDTASNTFTRLGSPITFPLQRNGNPGWTHTIYYAKNIIATSTDIVQVNYSSIASGTVTHIDTFEYSGADTTTPIDAWGTGIGPADYFTAYVSSQIPAGDLLVGMFWINGSAPAVVGPGFTDRSGASREDKPIGVTGYYAAEANNSSSYADFTGFAVALKPPASVAIPGVLDSTTYDTGLATGVQLNSVLWQGAANGGTVKFQFAVSNASSGPWSFVGPDGTSATYYTGASGAAINLVSTSNGYSLLNGYRYFRYRATLVPSGGGVSPRVDDVTVNWSP